MPGGFEGARPLEQVAPVSGWLRGFFKVEQHHPLSLFGPLIFQHQTILPPFSFSASQLVFAILARAAAVIKGVFTMREEKTAESFNQTQCSRNNDAGASPEEGPSTLKVQVHVQHVSIVYDSLQCWHAYVYLLKHAVCSLTAWSPGQKGLQFTFLETRKT